MSSLTRGRSSAAAIKSIHGVLKPALGPTCRGLCRFIKSRVHASLLFRRKMSKHVILRWNFSRRINADSQTRPMIAAKSTRDVGESIVSTIAALATQADRSARQRKVVRDHQHLFCGVKFVEANGLQRADAAEIHEGGWFQKKHTFASNLGLKQQSGETRFRRRSRRIREPSCQSIKHIEARVVAGCGVLGSRISKTNNKTHGIATGLRLLVLLGWCRLGWCRALGAFLVLLGGQHFRFSNSSWSRGFSRKFFLHNDHARVGGM